MGATARVAIPNFSRSTLQLRRRLLYAMVAISALLIGASVWLVADGLRLLEKAEHHRVLGQRLAVKVAELRDATTQAPSLEAFERLQARIVALNRLDFAAKLSVAELLDALETTLPDQVLLTSLRYDRVRGSVDLAAVSSSSEDLTRFFEALHADRRFHEVRLAEKLQVDGRGGGPQMQVRIYFEIGRPGGPSREARS